MIIAFPSVADSSAINLTPQEYNMQLYIITGVHGLLMIQLFFADVLNIKSVQTLTMGSGMLLSLLLLLMIAKMIYGFPADIWTLYNSDKKRYNGVVSGYFWLWIELASIAGLLFSNILFLFIRSCFRHKVTSTEKMTAGSQVAGVDSVYAVREYVQMFVS
jgi:hypothetical protein